MNNPKKGVGVKIEGKTAVKVMKVIEKTRRTFSTEVNIAVEEKMDEQIARYKDDGR